MLQERNTTGEDVSSTGELAEFTPDGRFVLDIELTATAAITVEVKIADGDQTAPQTTKTYTDVTSISDVLDGVAGSVLIEVTTAAGAGETADFYMGAGD